MNIIYVRTYSICTYIYIGTYLSSEGSEDSSEINFVPILGQKNWGKKIGINWQGYRNVGDIPINIPKRISYAKTGISPLCWGCPPKSGDIPLVNLPDGSRNRHGPHESVAPSRAATLLLRRGALQSMKPLTLNFANTESGALLVRLFTVEFYHGMTDGMGPGPGPARNRFRNWTDLSYHFSWTNVKNYIELFN